MNDDTKRLYHTLRLVLKCIKRLVMKTVLPVVITLIFFSPHVFSEPAVSGRSIGVACLGCHGTDGSLSKPVLPRLKSEPADRTYKALIEFKNDVKKSTIMGRIAKGYSNDELRAVAEYFYHLPKG